MDNLQGEVESFVSQLGFDRFVNKEISDDFDATPKAKPKKTQQKSKPLKEITPLSKSPDGSKKHKSSAGKKLEKQPPVKPRRPGKTQRPDDVPVSGRVQAVAAPGRSGRRASAQDQTAAGPGRPGRRARSRRRAAGPAVQVPEVSSTGESAEPPSSPPAPPLPTAEARWYQTSVTDGDSAPVQESVASQLLQEATTALNQAVKAFKVDGGGQPASQWSWTQTVLTSGTVSDKLAARQTLLRTRPQVNLHLAEDTVRMVAARGKDHAMQAMNMLADLFANHLLPPERKLKSFRQQPLGRLRDIAGGDGAARKRQLILWLFEDRLKTVYKEFVGRVREMAHDTVEKTRKHGVNTLAQLLVSHPELEQTLLETLVNKLGDEKKSVACLAVRRLSSLLRTHPAMRTIVVKEVERILFRQNVGKRVQFYGICFLSQVQFSDEGDEPLAERIVRIYVGFFRACVKQAELDARLMRALLTGLSGCVDRARLVAGQLQQYVQPLHHIAQLASFGVATQALLLMFRLTTAGGQTEPTDRYYSALYKKLVHPGLATSQKVADFLNLVYRSVKVDPCQPRARAFVKRLLQCCLHQTAALACSVLLLVSELFRRRPELAQVVGQPAAAVWTADDDDDEEEAPRDVPLPEEEEEEGEDQQQGAAPGPQADDALQKPAAAGPVPAGWLFVGAARPGSGRRRYDPLYREPRWCRAELAALHELALLRRHVHPTLALFAGQLADGRPTSYPGNPLHDFRLMNFLNRFCYRNPKKTTAKTEAARRLAVTSPGYARLPESQVPHDEKFFHRYFRWREEHGLAPAAPGRPLTDGSGDITDEAFDSFLDGFFGGKAGADSVDFASEIAEASEGALEREDEDGGEDDEDQMDLDGEPEDMDQDDLEDFDSLGEDSDDDPEFPVQRGRPLPVPGKSKKPKKGDLSDLFASAEEFSELLEDGAETADGSSQAAAGADRTSRKQLQWEEASGGKRRRQGSSVDFRAQKDRKRKKFKGKRKQKK